MGERANAVQEWQVLRIPQRLSFGTPYAANSPKDPGIRKKAVFNNSSVQEEHPVCSSTNVASKLHEEFQVEGNVACGVQSTNQNLTLAHIVGLRRPSACAECGYPCPSQSSLKPSSGLSRCLHTVTPEECLKPMGPRPQDVSTHEKTPWESWISNGVPVNPTQARGLDEAK